MILSKQQVIATTLLVLSVSITQPGNAYAVAPAIHVSHLNIVRNADGQLTACTTTTDPCPDENLALFIGNNVNVTMTNKEQLQIEIRNPNFVLFTYETGKLEEQKTDTAKALDDFFNKLKPLVPKKAEGQPFAGEQLHPMLSVDDVDVYMLEKAVQKISETKESLEAAIAQLTRNDATGLQETTKENKKDIATAVKILNKVAELKQKIILFQKIKISVQNSDSCLGKKSEKDTGKADTTDTYSHIDGQLEYCGQEIKNQSATLATALTYLESVTQLLSTLDALADAINKSTKPHQITATTISYSSRNDQIQHFTIGRNSAFDEFIDKEASNYRDKAVTGEFTITIKPRQNLLAYPAAGVFYSFVRNPTFTATKNAAGQMVITQQTNDMNAISGGLAMNFSTATYDGEYFRPHIQVGLIPDTDKFAFMLGVGIDIPTTVSSLDFGVIYQKVRELTNGLALGQQVTSSSDIATTNAWKAGPYIGINVKFE